ncbi:hypothetical protein [Kutzneria buriramensis]|uniref:Uncharacterized protein n=1 Tax=Kutzneria buriramensis TaxID=1045776 RepID=A0A3E0I8X2_9PSEU|nr:hypothetical protein [Kutzneria buriramensis]REH55051.1 hypothetical protein BCF44_10167 [Kutzneria buriramensis]
MRGTLRRIAPLWTRGEAGRPTPPAVTVALYTSWLVALAFKTLGASWDVAWHFKWIRDTTAPPHLVNFVGTGIAVALVLVHTYTGLGADRRTLRFLQVGMGSFVVTIPMDIVNHTVNGLDLTAWSVTHVLLYTGTTVTLIGLIMGWHKEFPRGHRFYRLGLAALWLSLLENLWFPNEQQEYGVLSLAAWDRGQPYAQPELLQFAAAQIHHPVDRAAVEHFALGLPEWLYPVWCVLSAAVTLTLAKRFLHGRFTATAIAACYVGYRTLALLFVTGIGFPPYAVPFWALAIGVAVDVAYLLRAPLTVAVLAPALGYLALWGQSTFLTAPPTDFHSWPAAVVVLLAVLVGIGGLTPVGLGWTSARTPWGSSASAR